MNQRIAEASNEETVGKSISSVLRNEDVPTTYWAGEHRTSPVVRVTVLCNVRLDAFCTEGVQTWQGFRLFQAIKAHFALQELVTKVLTQFVSRCYGGTGHGFSPLGAEQYGIHTA